MIALLLAVTLTYHGEPLASADYSKGVDIRESRVLAGPEPKDNTVPLVLGANVLCATIDVHSTAWAPRHNPRLVEANPLFDGVVAHIFVKAVSLVIVYEVSSAMVRAERRKLARVAGLAGAGVQCAAGLNNYRLGLGW